MDDVWIGGGGSGGSGEYNCAHQTALYNTRNKKCLPESPHLIFTGVLLAGYPRLAPLLSSHQPNFRKLYHFSNFVIR